MKNEKLRDRYEQCLQKIVEQIKNSHEEAQRRFSIYQLAAFAYHEEGKYDQRTPTYEAFRQAQSAYDMAVYTVNIHRTNLADLVETFYSDVDLEQEFWRYE